MPIPKKIISRFLYETKPVVRTDMYYYPKLVELKSLLVQNGIDDLSHLGNLKISGNIIVTAGILKPLRAGKLYLPQGTISKVPLIERSSKSLRGVVKLDALQARPLRTSPIKGLFNNLFLGIRGEIDDAVWVANEILIEDNTIVVFTNSSKFLTLIANKVTIGRNVEFTWQEPTFKIDNSQADASIPQKPQNKTPSSDVEIIHGEGGSVGRRGRNGQTGDDAPIFDLYTKEFNAQNPSFIFEGQNGQDGQDGQNGQGGQNGAKGISGKAVTLTGFVGWWCERYAGSGGNGGNGGRGGDGGDGGDGGRGGKISFYIPQSEINKLIPEGFYVGLSGGKAGNGGNGGQGGYGGRGGEIGNTHSTGFGFDCGPRRGANRGTDGNTGQNGRDGRNGKEGDKYSDAVNLHAIKEDEIDLLLNSPIIERVDPQSVSVGDIVTIKGRNFTQTDKVLFNEVQVNPKGIISDTSLSVMVPNVEGGHTRIRIIQVDGTHSSVQITLKVQPKILKIEQDGTIPSRFRVGKTIRVVGTGFVRNSHVFVEDRLCSGYHYIDDNNIEAILIRPFEENEFPSATGENVAIKIISEVAGFESNSFPITLDTVRLLIFGDSIAWGQGLQEHERAQTLLQDEIKRRNKGIGVYKDVMSHSGAIIGFDIRHRPNLVRDADISDHSAIDGEVPTSYPSILEQIDNYLKGRTIDDTVDLILMDGGINDVSLLNILNPGVNPADLSSLIEFYCHLSTKELLKTVINRFPNSKIIFTGYYKIISDSSDTTFIKFLLAGLGFSVVGVAGATVGLILDFAAISRIKENCRIFKEEANAKLALSVAEVISEFSLPNDRIVFVDPGFQDDNAVFAPDPLVYGINVPDLSPQDNSITSVPRATQCSLNSSRTNIFLCERASIGHPNPEGAKQYYQKILEQLDVIVPIE